MNEAKRVSQGAPREAGIVLTVFDGDPETYRDVFRTKAEADRYAEWLVRRSSRPVQSIHVTTEPLTAREFAALTTEGA